ncbi:hypothetical protein [Methylobacterium sp. Leaf85]|uniref:hypothetical protein n=1 Tax=Methylobacterium sp. Leaf85 TaxID=1736241 RepID=UPI0012E9191A|nr:hypothetical protein [Methylobacterium sp. Leaf85]
MRQVLFLLLMMQISMSSIAVASPGQVITIAKVVAAGHTLKLGTMSSLDQTCKSLGGTAVNIIDSPHNGEIYVQQNRDYPSYPTTNTRSRCNLQKVPVTQLFYTPNPGFRGDDTVIVELITPLGDVLRERFNISVR